MTAKPRYTDTAEKWEIKVFGGLSIALAEQTLLQMARRCEIKEFKVTLGSLNISILVKALTRLNLKKVKGS